jgi:hypothetical protein
LTNKDFDNKVRIRMAPTKSGNKKGGDVGKKATNKTKKLSAQEKAELKKQQDLDNRQKFRKYLQFIVVIECRIKYLIGMNLKFSEAVDLFINVPNSSQRTKETETEKFLKANFLLTSEFNWIDTGVIQRPFDVIKESESIKIKESDKPISVTSIQGFDEYIRGSEFETVMGDSNEMMVYEGWVQKFDGLQDVLFESNIIKVIKKIWGQDFKDFKFSWVVVNYRNRNLHVELGKEIRYFTFISERYYSKFPNKKSDLFSPLDLHEAGLNYAKHENIVPKVKL